MTSVFLSQPFGTHFMNRFTQTIITIHYSPNGRYVHTKSGIVNMIMYTNFIHFTALLYNAGTLCESFFFF